MSKINVDIDKIRAAKQTISDYVDYQKNAMKKSSMYVENMNEVWKGTDYERLKIKWTQLTNESSISAKSCKELESFSEYLDRCALEYDYLKSGLNDVANQYIK